MTLAAFFAGIACATFAAAAVFFLKFWRASRDSFFIYFSAACFLLAIERMAIVCFDHATKAPASATETGIWVYLLRLIAFTVIFVGILRKNQLSRTGPRK